MFVVVVNVRKQKKSGYLGLIKLVSFVIRTLNWLPGLLNWLLGLLNWLLGTLNWLLGILNWLLQLALWMGLNGDVESETAFLIVFYTMHQGLRMSWMVMIDNLLITDCWDINSYLIIPTPIISYFPDVPWILLHYIH